MSCDSENHNLHMCALKRQGLGDCIKSLSDKPTVECRQCGAKANSSENLCAAHLECRQCGAKANSSENLCAAHLGDSAPNVEGGHGSVDLEDVGKPHEGFDAETVDEPQIAIKQVPVDGVCGGY